MRPVRRRDAAVPEIADLGPLEPVTVTLEAMQNPDADWAAWGQSSARRVSILVSVREGA